MFSTGMLCAPIKVCAEHKKPSSEKQPTLAEFLAGLRLPQPQQVTHSSAPSSPSAARHAVQDTPKKNISQLAPLPPSME